MLRHDDDDDSRKASPKQNSGEADFENDSQEGRKLSKVRHSDARRSLKEQRPHKKLKLYAANESEECRTQLPLLSSVEGAQHALSQPRAQARSVAPLNVARNPLESDYERLLRLLAPMPSDPVATLPAILARAQTQTTATTAQLPLVDNTVSSSFPYSLMREIQSHQSHAHRHVSQPAIDLALHLGGLSRQVGAATGIRMQPQPDLTSLALQSQLNELNRQELATSVLREQYLSSLLRDDVHSNSGLQANPATTLGIQRSWLHGAPNMRLEHSLSLEAQLLALRGQPDRAGLPASRHGLQNESASSRPSLSLPAILMRPEDTLKLSSHQVLLRQQIEAFEATEDDISTHTRGRNKPIALGQVGIRCKHCAHLPVGRRQKGSTYFPASLMGLYQAAQNMSTTHFQCGLCTEMPGNVREKFAQLTSAKVASSGAGRPYWAESAKKLGLVDTEADGIRFAQRLRRGRSVWSSGER